MAVSMRSLSPDHAGTPTCHTSPYVTIRHHTSHIREQTSAYVSIREWTTRTEASLASSHTSEYVRIGSIRQHASAYVSISSLAYVSIRQHAHTYGLIRERIRTRTSPSSRSLSSISISPSISFSSNCSTASQYLYSCTSKHELLY